MAKLLVIGAGAAGMLAAGTAARRGLSVTLIERNERPGRKLMITGKGRCNLTNDCPSAEFLSNVPRNGRFLYSAVSAFGPAETMAFFEGLGVKLKVERGRRVFPQSDKAVDIVDALHAFFRDSGCARIHARAEELAVENGRVKGIRLEGGKLISADGVVLCTGGLSYPLTGSTGDGYAMAKAAGHTIIPTRPSLVPLQTQEGWPAALQGLSLKNVTLRVEDTQKGSVIFEELGEMLFTHYGVTGPLVLSASAHMREMEAGRYRLLIDLKPGLDAQQLDQRLQRDFLKFANHDLINALGDLLPAKLIPVFVSLSGIDPHRKVNQINRRERQDLCGLFKGMSCTVRDFRPVEEAVVTSGGVKVGEINPRTMESKIVAGLYFAGELLDVDAYTGGFNLQIAFSTGYAAGMHALAGEK